MTLDRYFDKQAIRAKLSHSLEGERRWGREQRATAATVEACTERLVRITMRAKCFRLNCDFLRQRVAAEGSSCSGEVGTAKHQRLAREEALLASRIEALQKQCEQPSHTDSANC